MKKAIFFLCLLSLPGFRAVSQNNPSDSIRVVIKKYDSLIVIIDSNLNLTERTARGRIRPFRTFSGTVYLSNDMSLIKKAKFSFRETPLDNYLVYLDGDTIISIIASGEKIYNISSKCFIRNGDNILPCQGREGMISEFEEIIRNTFVLFKE